MSSCDKATIAAYLNARVREKGWTCLEFSRRSGVPQQTVSRLLNAQTDNPQFISVCQLVAALGGSLDAMAGIPAPAALEPFDASHAQDTIDRQDQSILYLKDQIARLQAESTEKDALIGKQRGCISRRNFVIGLLAVLLGVFVTWDLMDPRYGFLYRVLCIQHEQSMLLLLKG